MALSRLASLAIMVRTLQTQMMHVHSIFQSIAMFVAIWLGHTPSLMTCNIVWCTLIDMHMTYHNTHLINLP